MRCNNHRLNTCYTIQLNKHVTWSSHQIRIRVLIFKATFTHVKTTIIPNTQNFQRFFYIRDISFIHSWENTSFVVATHVQLFREEISMLNRKTCLVVTDALESSGEISSKDFWRNLFFVSGLDAPRLLTNTIDK